MLWTNEAGTTRYCYSINNYIVHYFSVSHIIPASRLRADVIKCLCFNCPCFCRRSARHRCWRFIMWSNFQQDMLGNVINNSWLDDSNRLMMAPFFVVLYLLRTIYFLWKEAGSVLYTMAHFIPTSLWAFSVKRKKLAQRSQLPTWHPLHLYFISHSTVFLLIFQYASCNYWLIYLYLYLGISTKYHYIRVIFNSFLKRSKIDLFLLFCPGKGF